MEKKVLEKTNFKLFMDDKSEKARFVSTLGDGKTWKFSTKNFEEIAKIVEFDHFNFRDRNFLPLAEDGQIVDVKVLNEIISLYEMRIKNHNNLFMVEMIDHWTQSDEEEADRYYQKEKELREEIESLTKDLISPNPNKEVEK